MIPGVARMAAERPDSEAAAARRFARGIADAGVAGSLPSIVESAAACGGSAPSRPPLSSRPNKGLDSARGASTTGSLTTQKALQDSGASTTAVAHVALPKPSMLTPRNLAGAARTISSLSATSFAASQRKRRETAATTAATASAAGAAAAAALLDSKVAELNSALGFRFLVNALVRGELDKGATCAPSSPEMAAAYTLEDAEALDKEKDSLKDPQRWVHQNLARKRRLRVMRQVATEVLRGKKQLAGCFQDAFVPKAKEESIAQIRRPVFCEAL